MKARWGRAAQLYFNDTTLEFFEDGTYADLVRTWRDSRYTLPDQETLQPYFEQAEDEVAAIESEQSAILADLQSITRDNVQVVLDNIAADITAVQNATSLADVRQPLLRILNRQDSFARVLAALVARERRA
jgi:predicted  nucleic acid-binding Zn ribbon protein